MFRLARTAAVASILTITATAAAHTRLVSPIPRNELDGLKTGPCGNITRTDSPNVYEPGETITVDWLETINHPGYYRLAFSMSNDQDFDATVLADNVPDDVCSPTPCAYSTEITFPSVECDDCSLQLIQYMGTAEPYSPYFSCADIQLAYANGAPDAGVDPDPDPEPDGGCAVSRGAGGAAPWVLLALCALWSRRRR